MKQETTANKVTATFSGKFQKMQERYLNRKKLYRITKKEIEDEMERLKKKEAENIYPHWTEYLIRPLMHEIAQLTPDIQWDIDDKLTCFGLRAECPVFGQDHAGTTAAITFTFRNEQLHYDTGETKGNRTSDPNGLNNLTAPVESIDQLIAVVRCQMEKEKKATDKKHRLQ